MRSHARYAAAALILLLLEVLIALFVTDTFVRGYVGDVLAVLLVYAVLRATGLSVLGAVLAALVIALAIEVAQAFDLLGALGLTENRFARTVLGGVFDWLDIAAYLAGGAIAVAMERVVRRRGRERRT